jgi:hypothetical protein
MTITLVLIFFNVGSLSFFGGMGASHFFSGASWLFAELAKTKAQGPQTVRQF